MSVHEDVARIIHDDIVSLRVGALPWAEQPEGYRKSVAETVTVRRIVEAVQLGCTEGRG